MILEPDISSILYVTQKKVSYTTTKNWQQKKFMYLLNPDQNMKPHRQTQTVIYVSCKGLSENKLCVLNKGLILSVLRKRILQ